MRKNEDIEFQKCYNRGDSFGGFQDKALPADTLFNKRIWTIEDVVEFTGFSKSTVYKMTSRREIPHRKRGKKLFFLPDEIWNWIEES